MYIGFLLILVVKAVISFFSAMLTANIITNLIDSNFNEVLNLAIINLTILTIYHLLSLCLDILYETTCLS